MKKYTPLPIGIVLAICQTPALAQDISRQTVHLGPHLTATVAVGYNINDHHAQIHAYFLTDNGRAYDVNCLSVFRDIKYVLRDASGHIMPIDAAAWKTHIDTTTEMYTEYRCQNLPTSSGEKGSQAYVSDLYPSVPAGTYTLQITVAPRNLAESATLAPITVKL
jgi:hypothetical protein